VILGTTEGDEKASYPMKKTAAKRGCL